ncbi:ATP-binding protein [Sphingopyxis sp. MWB1]|uniref:ATP-binding protein n=1 Tax=Sphingopyxis sp. MWB1 TaxID=1537715 RepID=UPI000519F6CD|nr:ATP-binding protein [Sphingopyxis sp. MWB1]
MRLRLWPRSLVWQLVVAVALMLFLAQAINFALLVRGQKQQLLAHGGGMAVARIIDAIDRDRRGLFDAQGRDVRPQQHRSQRVRALDHSPPPPVGGKRLPELSAYVANLLNEADVPVQHVDAWAVPRRMPVGEGKIATQSVLVVAQVGSRHYLVKGRIPAGGDRLQGFLVWQTLSLYLLLLVPVILIAWRAAASLRALTRAARADPIGRDAPPLEEQGPSDVRELIRAFNSYRARIATMLADKDRMLGAVGHDLRTPLASLRVRVEQVEEAPLREKMIASIEEMTAMLTDILALARSGSGTEAQEQVALASFVERLAADYQEQGKAVLATDVADVTVAARPMLLRRAMRNLIDNAIAYGHRARLQVQMAEGRVRLVVSDDGPGLSEEQIDTLIEPFARGEQSRNRATGGAGLGLSIAREIAAGEGGALILANRAGGGLDAIIALPRP